MKFLKLWNKHMEQNTPQDAERQIALAEAQILGFIHGRGGYSLASLVESMGLKHSEWLVIKEGYPDDKDIGEIEQTVKAA